jgi:hypothetical protein
MYAPRMQVRQGRRFMRSIEERYDALATNDDTGSASGTHSFTLFLPRHITPAITRHLCANAGRAYASERLDAISA